MLLSWRHKLRSHCCWESRDSLDWRTLHLCSHPSYKHGWVYRESQGPRTSIRRFLWYDRYVMWARIASFWFPVSRVEKAPAHLVMMVCWQRRPSLTSRICYLFSVYLLPRGTFNNLLSSRNWLYSFLVLQRVHFWGGSDLEWNVDLSRRVVLQLLLLRFFKDGFYFKV